MRKKCIPTLIATLLIAGLLSSSVQTGEEFAVFPSSDDQEAPDVHGTIVVWQQYVYDYGDYDIYVADINFPTEARRETAVNVAGF